MYKCTKGFSLEKCDDDGFTLDGEYIVIEEGSTWDIPENAEYRFIGGDVRLERNKPNEVGWIEISEETLEENFEIIKSVKEEIYQMYESGYSVEEIAENLSEFDCVQSFRDCPEWCHEDADCNNCWIKCLEEELEN